MHLVMHLLADGGFFGVGGPSGRIAVLCRRGLSDGFQRDAK